MANFQYIALDSKGEQTTGVIQANSDAEAVQALRGQGLYPGKVKPKVLMIFTRQLATLIDSGLPLLRGLNVLGKQEPNPVLKATINNIADSVQGGSTFSEVVLTRLAEYQEKAHKLKGKIVSAMVYPMIVMFIAVAIMSFLMLFIVPKFRTMFEDMSWIMDVVCRLGPHCKRSSEA